MKDQKMRPWQVRNQDFAEGGLKQKLNYLRLRLSKLVLLKYIIDVGQSHQSTEAMGVWGAKLQYFFGKKAVLVGNLRNFFEKKAVLTPFGSFYTFLKPSRRTTLLKFGYRLKRPPAFLRATPITVHLL